MSVHTCSRRCAQSTTAFIPRACVDDEAAADWALGLWLALADFDDSAVSNEVVDAKLDGWELQGAQIRKEARRLQRQGAAET